AGSYRVQEVRERHRSPGRVGHRPDELPRGAAVARRGCRSRRKSGRNRPSELSEVARPSHGTGPNQRRPDPGRGCVDRRGGAGGRIVRGGHRRGNTWKTAGPYRADPGVHAAALAVPRDRRSGPAAEPKLPGLGEEGHQGGLPERTGKGGSGLRTHLGQLQRHPPPWHGRQRRACPGRQRHQHEQRQKMAETGAAAGTTGTGGRYREAPSRVTRPSLRVLARPCDGARAASGGGGPCPGGDRLYPAPPEALVPGYSHQQPPEAGGSGRGEPAHLHREGKDE
ncbi:unnamed protein product, partial [Ectocarpus sp. 13 AM-2016]